MDRSGTVLTVVGRGIAVVLGLAVALAAGPRAAIAGENARERAQDRVEIRRDRAEVTRDVMEVRKLERLLREFDDANRRYDGAAERRLRHEIHAFIERETADARQQVAKDRRELRRSGRELRRDRRQGNPGHGDRRDLRDDVWDLATSKGRLAHQREIIFELHALQPRIRRNDRIAEARERELYQEFLSIARRDAAATGRELGEDRHELRRDRRGRP